VQDEHFKTKITLFLVGLREVRLVLMVGVDAPEPVLKYEKFHEALSKDPRFKTSKLITTRMISLLFHYNVRL